MRIGRVIIDTDNMCAEELRILEREIRAIRKRREEAESFKARMNSLLEEAREAGFDFIDKDFGNVIRPVDVDLYDNQ